MRMRMLRLLPFILVTSALAEPIVTPKEVHLVGGQTLQQVVVTKWQKDSIVVRYLGGVTPIRYAHMAPASRQIFEALHSVTHECNGSAYVVTRGAGAYKLANIVLTITPEIGYASIQPAITTRTDGEGKFKFKWKGPGNFTIEATASRLAGGETEVYFWSVTRPTIPDLADIQLSNHNLR